MPKLTSDAECPPHVSHAHELEDAITEKIDLHDLDDNEIGDIALWLAHSSSLIMT